MSRGSVSVVIPVHNGGRFLAETLESVFAQDYPLREVIVVDDGSTDNTFTETRRFEKTRYFYQEKKGVSAARNLGVREASGEFIAFQDADDLWIPNKISRQMDYMLSHPDTGYSAGKTQNFYDPVAAKDPWLPEKKFRTDAIGFSTVVAKSELFTRDHFWFNEDMVIGEDMEWFFRVKTSSVKGYIFPDVLTHRRLHDRNLTRIHGGDAKKTLLDLIRYSVRSRRAEGTEENDD